MARKGASTTLARRHSRSQYPTTAVIIPGRLSTSPAEPINLGAHEGQEREINLTDQSRVNLQQLKVLYERPEKTWILDFEYVSMPKRFSPNPLQLAIRQLGGKLLYQGNTDYGLSMKEFIDATSSYVSGKHGMMGTLFLGCYGGIHTNGETSLQVIDHIIKTCGYNPDDIKILSVCCRRHAVFPQDLNREQ